MSAADYKELSTRNPEWQREAARLARLKIPFVLTGFNPELDTAFFEALKLKYNLDATVDPTAARIQFTPPPGGETPGAPPPS
jgi:hypothetical protein